jgi:hypothetical protein
MDLAGQLTAGARGERALGVLEGSTEVVAADGLLGRAAKERSGATGLPAAVPVLGQSRPRALPRSASLRRLWPSWSSR